MSSRIGGHAPNVITNLVYPLIYYPGFVEVEKRSNIRRPNNVRRTNNKSIPKINRGNVSAIFGELITKTLKGLSENPTDNRKIENEVRNEVINLTSSFPIYKNLK